MTLHNKHVSFTILFVNFSCYIVLLLMNIKKLLLNH